jgi:uncharacterized protein (DUF3820 family)
MVASKSHKASARIDFLYMPIGKFRGCLIRDLPEYASGYADWLLGQPWFRRRYPDEALALARAVKRWGDPEQRQLIVDEHNRAFEKRETERIAQWERQKQEWLYQHIVKYDPRGVMPFGKYKGQLLDVVARDDGYCRWFTGSAYSSMNPGLAADLDAACQRPSPPFAEVEHRGSCVVFWPAVFCRWV